MWTFAIHKMDVETLSDQAISNLWFLLFIYLSLHTFSEPVSSKSFSSSSQDINTIRVACHNGKKIIWKEYQQILNQWLCLSIYTPILLENINICVDSKRQKLKKSHLWFEEYKISTKVFMCAYYGFSSHILRA